jgi:hypothetical protein
MERGWAIYDLTCRHCGNKGLLGVWIEFHMGGDVWNSEWDGFFGVVDHKSGLNRETVQCAACLSAEVNAIVRDEPVEADHALLLAWA